MSTLTEQRPVGGPPEYLEFGHEHWSMTIEKLQSALKQQCVPYKENASKAELCRLLGEHCAQKAEGEGRTDTAWLDTDFDASKWTKGPLRWVLHLYKSKFDESLKQTELAKKFKEELPRFRSEHLSSHPTEHAAASQAEPPTNNTTQLVRPQDTFTGYYGPSHATAPLPPDHYQQHRMPSASATVGKHYHFGYPGHHAKAGFQPQTAPANQQQYADGYAGPSDTRNPADLQPQTTAPANQQHVNGYAGPNNTLDPADFYTQATAPANQQHMNGYARPNNTRDPATFVQPSATSTHGIGQTGQGLFASRHATKINKVTPPDDAAHAFYRQAATHSNDNDKRKPGDFVVRPRSSPFIVPREQRLAKSADIFPTASPYGTDCSLSSTRNILPSAANDLMDVNPSYQRGNCYSNTDAASVGNAAIGETTSHSGKVPGGVAASASKREGETKCEEDLTGLSASLSSLNIGPQEERERRGDIFGTERLVEMTADFAAHAAILAQRGDYESAAKFMTLGGGVFDAVDAAKKKEKKGEKEWGRTGK